MNNNELADYLQYHQDWRRGADTEMVNPTDLGDAIDDAISIIRKAESTETQLKEMVDKFPLELGISYRELEKKVIQWGSDKKLLGKSQPEVMKQTLKFASEAGELCDAIAKEDRDEQIDAIGDVMVTLILLCNKLELRLPECLESSYNVIKDRTGITVNGTFIKQN